MTGPTLEDLAIPIPTLPGPDRSAEISQPPAPDIAPDFGAPRKRTRGGKRRPQPEQAPDSPQLTTPVDAQPMALGEREIAEIGKALGVGFRVMFAIVASSRGQHWQISPGDEQLLGQSWATALAPWLLTSAKYVPLAVATLATVGVVAPRITEDAKLRPPIEPPRNPDVPPVASVGVSNAAAI